MSAQLEQWASDLIKARVPFLPHGRDRQGLDCWGIPCLAYKELLGIALPSQTDKYLPTDIHNYNHLRDIICDDLPNWEEVLKGKPFDIMLLRLRGRPIHVGLVTRPGFMLHIEEGIEVCEESYEHSFWKNRVVGIYRPRSL